MKPLLLSTLCLLCLPLSAEPLSESLEGKLVKHQDGKLVPAGEKPLEGKKIIAVYYSAHWCPPCRAFTPSLVEFYNEQVKEHPEFELIFVSSDRTEEAMAEYMKWGDMPFPAMTFEERRNPVLKQHAARGIPYMVVLNDQGEVLIEKDEGKDWLYPGQVLPRLAKLLDENKEK